MLAADGLAEKAIFDGQWLPPAMEPRGVPGSLIIEGHRLDAGAPGLRADIPGGYGDLGFIPSGLIFPTPGCWKVTGRVADASLPFVVQVVPGDGAGTPIPVSVTPTIE